MRFAPCIRIFWTQAARPRLIQRFLRIKGDLLTKLGAYEPAADLYEDIIEERDIPWAYLSLGKIRHLQGDYDEALEVFDGMVKENPLNVAAYDELAKVYEALDEPSKAQATLNKGVVKSPKSLVRQRKLAQLAHRNGDLDTAKSAYEQAIRIGKHSCYRQPDDYNGLAKTLIESGKPDDAIRVAEDLCQEYRDDPEASMVAAVTEGMAHAANGNKEAADDSLQQALQLFDENPRGPSNDIALELTALCLSSGKEDEANTVVEPLVRNHHDDKDLIDRTKQIYAEAGKSDLGDEVVNRTTAEIVEINNKGAHLLKEGKLEESIELFMKAARGMPDNVVVNLNAAYSIIKQMEKTGKMKKYSSRVANYLERVHNLDPANKKYHELMDMLRRVSAKQRTRAA